MNKSAAARQAPGNDGLNRAPIARMHDVGFCGANAASQRPRLNAGRAVILAEARYLDSISREPIRIFSEAPYRIYGVLEAI